MKSNVSRRQHDRELLGKIMHGKDLWMMRALVLQFRLMAMGVTSEDVIGCEDKQQLYEELQKAKNPAKFYPYEHVT